MADPYISQIKQFANTFPPRNWSWCDGQLMEIAENTALYALLGTNFGGDGRATFGIPDLRGRFPIGAGTGPGLSHRFIGQRGGWESTVIQDITLPAHSHNAGAHAASEGSLSGTPNSSAAVKCNNTASAGQEPSGKVWGKFSGRDTLYADNVSGTDHMHAGAVQVSVDLSSVTVNINTSVDVINVNNSGGMMGHDNMMPFQVTPYCISLQGIFPSRN